MESRWQQIQLRQQRLGTYVIDIELEKELDSGESVLADAERQLDGIEASQASANQLRLYQERVASLVDSPCDAGLLTLDHVDATVLAKLEQLRTQAPSRRLQRCAQQWGVEASEEAILAQQTTLSTLGANANVGFECQVLHAVQYYNVAVQQPIESRFRLFGRLSTGDSVCVDVGGFDHYFLLKIPSNSNWTANRIEDLQDSLNALTRRLKLNAYTVCRRHACTCTYHQGDNESFAPQFTPCVKSLQRVPRIVKRVERIHGRSIVGYHPSEDTFLKIVLELPCFQRLCTQWLRREMADSTQAYAGCELFEADLKPLMRFMVDTNLVGGGWIKVVPVQLTPFSKQHTRCRVECRASVDAVTTVESTANTPFKVLALDIECMAMDVNVFPTADRCPVIQVSTMVRIYGDEARDEKRVFCLHETANLTNVPDAIVSCPNEAALFLALFRYILSADPDIVTGYNSNKFDLPYLFQRADTLGLRWFRNLSKLREFATVFHKQVFSSAQAGTKESMHYILPGRITMDVFELIKSNFKLRSYSLNAVSQHFLNDEKKDDLSYKDIPRFQTESPQTRGVIAKYCLQDTVLVMLLIDKLQLVVNNLEMARVVGVNMCDVWERGQSFKILRKLMQYTVRRNVFIPTYEKNSDGKTYVPYYDTIKNESMQTVGVDRTRQRSMDEFQCANQTRTRKRRLADQGRTIAFQGATVLEPTVSI